MRRGKRLPLDQLQPYLIDVAQPRPTNSSAPQINLAPLNWREIFGNDRPLEIEVGFGKGLFLINAGSNCPDTNFLGIENERKYALFTANRLAKRQLSNVKLAACDARWFLSELVASNSVQAVHVYFPDPWWKTRHRKRRLFTTEFAVQCARVLKPSGRLYFVSDVADYFHESVAHLSATTGLDLLPAAEAAEASGVRGYLTNFERKYRLEGRPIFRAELQKQ